MPKNKGKGGKNRRRGKNENEGLKRELVFKEDGQEYAQVRLKLILLKSPKQSNSLGTLSWSLRNPISLKFYIHHNEHSRVTQEFLIDIPR